MSDQHLDLPGARIAFSVSGSGAPVTIVAHGLTSSRADAAAEGFLAWPLNGLIGTIVRFDARGHGASTGSPDAESYVWSRLSDDLIALADAVSPAAPVDVIGASMGAATALWAALRRPERLHRLVLAIPPTAWVTGVPSAESHRAGAALVERSGAATWKRAAAIEPSPEILTSGGWAWTAAPAVADELLPAVFRGAAGSDLPTEAELASVSHETLLLPWTTDPGHPVSTAMRLAELLPNATLETAETADEVRGWDARVVEFLGR